jgi:hypothetical protein
MKDREQRYINDLERCRANIDKTKSLIEYHKNMLKKLEKKELLLISKLDKVKMNALCDVINKGGYDIDSFRNAVLTGDFESILGKNEVVENEDDIMTTKEIKTNDEEKDEHDEV